MTPGRRSRWFHLAIVAIVCSLVATSVSGATEPSNLPNFHQVSRDLYRGGQPEPGAIDDLVAMGIRSVISLRRDGDEVARERRLAEASGLTYYHVSFRPFGRPGDEDVRRVLELIATEDNQPMFVHCKRGADRTGTVIACHRILREGWTPADALAEAKAFGLGWWQFGMKGYIKGSCGMEKP